MRVLVSLAFLLLSIWFSWLTDLGAQSTTGSSISQERQLDVVLQGYAYRGFVRPKTGTPYEGAVPSNLTGIKIAAMRLRSGSLRVRGVKMYKEFTIPPGVMEEPYVERLVLVYQNLGNWSEIYYPLPGYTYLAPVLGLLAYDASNLSATNLAELDLRSSKNPISILFSDVRGVPDGCVAKCVWFDLQGLANFSNVASGHRCLTTGQGHFSIVTKSIAPVPSPSDSDGKKKRKKKSKKKSKRKLWVMVGSVGGGLFLSVLLSVVVICVWKCKQRKEMEMMEMAAEVGEYLHMTTVGGSVVPSARVMRTQPILETEHHVR